MFFSDCWTVLGISRTSDQQLIKSAYRQLVKKHHPDLGRNPEDIRKRTLKLVAINSAYQRALKEAIILSGGTSSQTIAEQVIPSKPSSTRFDWATVLSVILCIIFGFLILIGIRVFGDWVSSRPDTDPIRLLVGLVAMIMVGIFFASIVGLFDVFIASIACCVSEMIGLEKYANKIAWLTIVIAHTAALAIFFPQMEFGSSNKHMPPAFGVIFLMIVFYLFPLLLFLNWVNTYLKFRRLENSKAFLFPTEKE